MQDFPERPLITVSWDRSDSWQEDKGRKRERPAPSHLVSLLGQALPHQTFPDFWIDLTVWGNQILYPTADQFIWVQVGDPRASMCMMRSDLVLELLWCPHQGNLIWERSSQSVLSGDKAPEVISGSCGWAKIMLVINWVKYNLLSLLSVLLFLQAVTF